MSKILLIEDEPDLAEVIKDNLRDEGYTVYLTKSGRKALSLWQKLSADLIILDVMLPDIDGFEVCKQIRNLSDDPPILFISAKGRPEDRIKGLKLGGDDYLVKPFSLSELLLRVQNMLRRSKSSAHTHRQYIEIHGTKIDLSSGIAQFPDGKEIRLGSEELRLLNLFAAKKGQIIDRDTIIENVWPNAVYPSSREILALLEQLRTHFEPDPKSPKYFISMGGIRFKLELPED